MNLDTFSICFETRLRLYLAKLMYDVGVLEGDPLDLRDSCSPYKFTPFPW